MQPPILGRYVIQHELPRSGGGTVYNALDPDFEGEVAIKVLPPFYYRDPARRYLFEQEARLLALLENPGIVPIVEIAEIEGRLHIIMRWMPGGSLAQRLEKGPLDPEEAGRIIFQVGRTLESMHAVGIVHRNIKPSNILFDENGEACLSDSGMHKLAEVQPEWSANYLCGAPAYASPEEALGSAAVDERSDIYALGGLLFHMLTGNPPVLPGAPAEMAARQITTPAPDLRQLRPDLPEVYAAAIECCLQKNRDDRYASVTELLAVLFELPEGETAPEYDHAQAEAEPPARRPGGIGRVVKWAFTLVLLVVLGVGGYLLYGAWQLVLDTVPERIVQSLLPETIGEGFLLSAAQPSPIIIYITATPELAPAAAPTVTPGAIAAAITEQAYPPPTPLPLPTSVPTANAISPPTVVLGGADKIAFLHQNDIWLANLDGTDPIRLTTDGTPKERLTWTPDGRFLIYRTNGMLRGLDPVYGLTLDLGRFADYAISPDMTSVILGDKVEFDRKIEKWINVVQPVSISTITSLVNMRLSRNDHCAFQGGWLTQISPDGQRIATVIEVTQGGRKMEVIQVMEYPKCGDQPKSITIFPGEETLIRGYSGPKDSPVFHDYTWNGANLFAFNGDVRNGYGDLVVFDISTRKMQLLAPIEGQCCYRDLRWSPDGTYLLFTFVDFRFGDQANLYYLPWDAVSQPDDYAPIPLPAYLFEDRLAQFWPALRPAQGP